MTGKLLDRFEFDILPYLELTDFLLAAILNPEALAVSALFFLLYFSLFKLDRKNRKRWAWYARSMEWSQRMTRVIPIWLSTILGALAYLYIACQVAADRIYLDIRDKVSPEFSLSLIYPMNPGGKEVRMLQPVQLISRTSGYLVLYYDQQVMLIPHANVAAFVPIVKEAATLHQKTETPAGTTPAEQSDNKDIGNEKAA